MTDETLFEKKNLCHYILLNVKNEVNYTCKLRKVAITFKQNVNRLHTQSYMLL